MDAQEFPEGVDVTLVEGAVSLAGRRGEAADDPGSGRKLLVALGDCAVTGNVPAMRNTIPLSQLLQRIYVEGADEQRGVPAQGVPPLLAQARPVHEFVKVDVHLPGCPPRPEAIAGVLTDLLEGQSPNWSAVKFG